ncbi:MAG: hypothetical protein GY906_33915, partial [bacterium]|nr:hypothetical protein [bacterium]
PGSGAIAAAIIATTPAVFEMATVCGTELGVAAFGTCAWLILLTHKTQRDNRAYVLVGILVGLAVGCKYLALANVALPLGLVMMAMSWPRTRNGIGWLAVWLRPVAITTVIAIGVAAPWAIRNMVATGNPVYPYLAGSLASSSSETADSTTDIAEGIGDLQIQPQRFRSALTLGTFERLGFAGKPGAVYLWLLPLWIFGLFRRTADPHSRLLFAAFALGVLAWALAPPFGRYLIPTLALGAAGIAAAFEQATRKMPRGLTIGLLCVMAIVMLGNINPFKTQYVAAQTAVTLGLTPEGTLLNRHVSHWPAVEVINALPADSRVLLIAEARTFGIDRDLVAQDPIGRPMLVTLCEQEDSSDEVLGRLREMGITHVLVNHKEADRMALYNHRKNYLECDRPDAQQRLNEVLNGSMLAVWRLEHLELFVVPPPLEVPSG